MSVVTRATEPLGITEPARRAASSSASAPGAPLFVWGIWALMLLAALAFVGKYGSNMPMYDEWEVIPRLTGHQPASLAWLWSQHNEHRIPLPMFLFLGLFKLAGNDLRAGMFFNVLALGALAFAMIRVAASLRGQISYADAFFPLVLLHWGHHINFLMSWQLAYVVPIALAGALLLIIARRGAQLTRSAAILAGICLLLLPLCGPNGLAFVPALALWLGYAAALRLRSAEPDARRTGLLMLGFALAALGLAGFYFVGYEKPSHLPSSPGLRATLRTSLQFLGMSLGPAGKTFWPYSGRLAAGLLLVSAAVVVAGAWRAQPGERPRAVGLLLFLGAMVCLALGLGWGRAGIGPHAGLEARYVTLAAPALCWAYLVWVIYGPPGLRPFVQMCLFTVACVLFLFNVQAGREWAASFLGERNTAFERHLRAGTPLSTLVEYYDHYFKNIDSRNEDKEFTESLRLLRQAGVGPFRHLRADPAVREVPIPVVPAAVNQMTWNNGAGRGIGNNPYLLFALKGPRFVHAIRLKCSYADAAVTSEEANFQMFWKKGANAFTDAERSVRWSLDRGRGERTMTIWVNDTVDRFRIHPDNKPCVFRLSRIVLLAPATGSKMSAR